MSGPHITLDPDPLIDPLWLAELEADAWDRGYDARDAEVRSPLLGFVVVGLTMLVVGLLLGAGAVHAVPRPAPAVTEAPGMGVREPQPERTEAPPTPTAGPAQDPRASRPAVVVPTPPLIVVRIPTAQPPARSGGRRGIATYCAPTPTRCQSWGGSAMLGAVPSFRWGDEPYRVRVCRTSGPAACATVTVVSYCGCPDGRIIDLSPTAFRQLAPLSAGIVWVIASGIR